jgi:DNA-binding CsgD family transcriptional regulator
VLSEKLRSDSWESFCLTFAARSPYITGSKGSTASGDWEAVLDRLSQGIAIFDFSSRKIVFLNRVADDMLRAADGLSLSAAGITADRHEESAEFLRLIEGAARARDGLGRAGGVMKVTRSSGRTPYSVMVAPLPTCTGEATQQAIGIFIHDPESQIRAPEAELRALYGLSAAEARLATLLIRGKGMREAADTLFISIHTARTHMKRIFAKTDTHRQSDLVRLILKMGAGVTL